ncbi:MAG TPA: isoprenylcysteine carboxylmethyltransferase family protein [Anaerolineales bacterium]
MAAHKDHAEVKIHPPVLALIYLVIVYLVKRYIPISLVVPDVLRNIGITLVVIGIMLGFGVVWEFGKSRTTLNPHGSVTSIVTSGVFRFSRNPIYLGFVLMLIGFPLYTGTYWGLFFAPLLVISFNELVIQYEEAYLEKKFGDEYTSFKSRVRRWL